MKKTELKYLIKEILLEDIFLQNRKSPEEKAKTRELEIELEYRAKFGVEVYEGDIKLTKQMLPYFKKYSKIKKIIGGFSCIDLELKSLTEIPMPKEVGEYFNCSHNQLTTLDGAPKIVRKTFSCSNNKLTSLKGAPKYVGDNFWCDNNKLTTLEGAPKYVGGSFDCYDNSTQFTKEDVRKVCDVKGNVYN